MKWLGLIGGMSWESTAVYYQLLNKQFNNRHGGLHSAPVLMLSVDFAPLEKWLHEGRWDDCGNYLADCAIRLQNAGADIILLCTNTMHMVAPAITERLSVPFLHIAEAVGEAIKRKELNKVALLGTRPTMEASFYRSLLLERFGLQVTLPTLQERIEIDRIIFEELCRGQIRDSSRSVYLDVIERLAAEGAQGVILGCTEIGMLIRQQDTGVPLFDTTTLHVEAALELFQP